MKILLLTIKDAKCYNSTVPLFALLYPDYFSRRNAPDEVLVLTANKQHIKMRFLLAQWVQLELHHIHELTSILVWINIVTMVSLTIKNNTAFT